RQDRLQRVERVEVLARILLARGAVPRIVNDNFRREVSDTGSKLLPETVTSKAKTVRRRRTDAHIFFESVAVQFRKFSGKAKLTVLRLYNHGLKFPVQREAEPFVGGCACFSERDSGARFSNARCALRYQTGNERAIRSAPRDDDAGAFAAHAHESESVPLRFENVNGARIQFTDHKRARLRALWHVSP